MAALSNFSNPHWEFEHLENLYARSIRQDRYYKTKPAWWDRSDLTRLAGMVANHAPDLMVSTVETIAGRYVRQEKYETRIFGGDHDDYGAYSTDRDEAYAEHVRCLDMVTEETRGWFHFVWTRDGKLALNPIESMGS